MLISKIISKTVDKVCKESPSGTTNSTNEHLEKKTIIKVIVFCTVAILIIASITITISLTDNTKNGFTFSEQSDGTYTVKNYSKNNTYVTIPSTFKNKPVTGISSGAFDRGDKIKTLIVPDSITNISYAAFKGCTSLESITLPFIGMEPDGNPYLTYIFNDQDLSAPKQVPKTLKKVYLSNQCTKLSNSAFHNCPNIKEIHIPSSVIIIEAITNSERARPFYGCSFQLTIYCEVPEKPEHWSEYWNYISNNQKANVNWGSK